MRISEIVRAKGATIYSVSDRATLGDALLLMHRLKIGSAVVMDSATGEPLGIISQPDMLAALALLGERALRQQATAIMRRHALFCDADASVANALARMTRERVRHLLVRSGRDAGILGILSLGDLVAAQLEEMQLESRVLRDMARSALVANGTV